MVNQFTSDGHRAIKFESYLQYSMNFNNCKSAVIAFIAATVLHLYNSAKHKNGLVIFLSNKQKILLHKKKLLLEQNCPLKVQNEQVNCAPICFGFCSKYKVFTNLNKWSC